MPYHVVPPHRPMQFDLTDALYQHLLDRFPADRDYPRGALYVEGMPPLIASLLGRTLDRWLEHELNALESRWFDFEDPGVRAARAELIVALGRTARVPRGAWAETLRYAVGAVVRHLVTPAPALTDATFESEEEALPTDTVRARLYTFEAYPYLPEIADAYLKQKRPESVDAETFEGLLERIDRRVTSEYRTEDWLRLLGPLFKIARRIPEAKGLPHSVLEEFFSAKGQEAVARAVTEHPGKTIDESALHDLLIEIVGAAAPEGAREPDEPWEVADEIEPAEPAAEPPGDTETAEEVEEVADSDPAAHREAQDGEDADEEEADETDDAGERLARADHTASPTTGDAPRHPDAAVHRRDVADRKAHSPSAMPAPPEEPEPLWKRFAGHTVGPTVETSIPDDQAEPVREEAAHDRAPDAGDGDLPLWRRFLASIRGDAGSGRQAGVDPAGAMPAARPPSLENVEARVLGRAGRRQRHRFVRDLFAGDEHAYLTVLEKLDGTETWGEASQIIAEEVFRRFGVDIYSSTAVDFTDTVNKQFER